MTKKIAIISGSIRHKGFSTRLAKVVAGLFPEGYETEFVEIDNLPLYNQDHDSEPQIAICGDFRQIMHDKDAVVFVTPEHNRSIPSALKNALDIGSRPYGQSVWNGKPALVISNSPGAIGGFGANHHLRQVLSFLNMPVVQQPEAYIGGIDKFLGENNQPTESNMAYLQSIVDTFVELIDRVYMELP